MQSLILQPIKQISLQCCCGMVPREDCWFYGNWNTRKKIEGPLFCWHWANKVTEDRSISGLWIKGCCLLWELPAALLCFNSEAGEKSQKKLSNWWSPCLLIATRRSASVQHLRLQVFFQRFEMFPLMQCSKEIERLTAYGLVDSGIFPGTRNKEMPIFCCKTVEGEPFHLPFPPLKRRPNTRH